MTANSQDGICATEHQIQASERPGGTQKAVPKQLKWTRRQIHEKTDKPGENHQSENVNITRVQRILIHEKLCANCGEKWPRPN